MNSGSLTIVGTGIRAGFDTSIEAKACISSAQEVLYLVADALSASWIEQSNPAAQSLAPFYEAGKPRYEIYEATMEAILERLRRGVDLCVAFYGHPGFFAFAGHEVIIRARREGFKARMLPHRR